MSDGNIEGMFRRTQEVLYPEPGAHWPPQADKIRLGLAKLNRKEVDLLQSRHARKESGFGSIVLGKWRD